MVLRAMVLRAIAVRRVRLQLLQQRRPSRLQLLMLQLQPVRALEEAMVNSRQQQPTIRRQRPELARKADKLRVDSKVRADKAAEGVETPTRCACALPLPQALTKLA